MKTINVLLAMAVALHANAGDLPEEIQSSYSQKPSQLVSDEFNTGSLDRDKWAYRTQNGDIWGIGTDYVAFEKEGELDYISIKGTWPERKGGGIVTKNEAHFGFYSVGYRTTGIQLDRKTIWHPAIWMAGRNFAEGDDHRVIADAKQNVEIDLLEYYFFPDWNSHVIAWGSKRSDGKDGPYSQKMVRSAQDFGTRESGWQQLGLEYRPDYFQLWRKESDGWKRLGKRVPIDDAPTSEESMNRAHAKPGYWILSNKYHFEQVKKSWLLRDRKEGEYDDFRFEDSSLDIDFFRYYPVK